MLAYSLLRPLFITNNRFEEFLAGVTKNKVSMSPRAQRMIALVEWFWGHRLSALFTIAVSYSKSTKPILYTTLTSNPAHARCICDPKLASLAAVYMFPHQLTSLVVASLTPLAQTQFKFFDRSTTTSRVLLKALIRGWHSARHAVRAVKRRRQTGSQISHPSSSRPTSPHWGFGAAPWASAGPIVCGPRL